MSNSVEDFFDWFGTGFQRELDSFTSFGADWSWDRKAAWLLWQERTNNMAGKRGGRKAAVNETAARLLEALKFLSVGYKASGNEMARHTLLRPDGWAVSFDGVIEAGFPLGINNLDSFPDTKLLTDALGNVGKELEITSLDEGLYIKSGDFEATIENGDLSQVQVLPPDAQQYPVDDRFKDALVLCGRIVKDTAEEYKSAVIYSNGYSLIAFTGAMLVEAYHGNNMPPGLCYPKAFAIAVKAVDKKMTGFGYAGGNSLTVWFEDGSFIRTQLYTEPYPVPIDRINDLFNGVYMPLPTGTIEAVAAVAPFGGDFKGVAFRGGYVVADPYQTSSGLLEWNASKAVKALPDSPMINGGYFLTYADAVGELAINTERRQVMLRSGPDYTGVPVRFCLAAIQEPQFSQTGTTENNEPSYTRTFSQDPSIEDDIPF